MTLKVTNLSGGYYHKEIISDLNFTIHDGEIVCMAGLNGAGKSTTIRHIMGLMKPFKGEISLDGQKLSDQRMAYQKQIAYIPETPMIYDDLTLRDHIELTALSYDISKDEAMDRAQPLLDLFRLNRQLDWFPVDFSKGMKQKVMIICAFITQAKLMIIDEPFIGLDPLAMRDFIKLMQEAKARGAGILMSTHVLSSVKNVCDRMLILEEGKVRAQGSLPEIAQLFDLDINQLDLVFEKMMVQTAQPEEGADRGA